MNSPDQNPKLPMWIFFATDVVLVGAAWFIGDRSARPLSIEAAGAIVACIVVGALVGLVPLIVYFERQKNEMLDDRQRALESLARTVSSSAEQISIAANGLNQIAELVQKNLRHADQLPHKLQEKIAEFQAQLVNASDADKEELEKELVALRTTESERLESISDKIAKSTVEWARLEAATHQHLTAASEAAAKLSHSTAGAIAKAQAAAEQALTQARVEAARAVGEASGSATRAVEAAKTAAFAELEDRLAAATTTMVERLARELDVKLATAIERATRDLTGKLAATVAAFDERMARLEPTPPKGEADPAIMNSTPDTPAVAEAAVATIEENAPAGSAPVESAPKSDQTAHPPKRPRKSRRDEPASTVPAAEPTPAAAPPAPPPSDVSLSEPPPILVGKIPEIAPVAPHTTDPFPNPVAPVPEPTAPPPPPAPGAATAGATVRPKPPRKRAAKKAPVEAGLALGIDGPPPHPDGGSTTDAGTESARGEPAESVEQAGPEIVERVRTSDGATRLIVTAYIGIGNRLFIRGEGPGLSWEKGLPLQFVSIGKWRWETNEATGPVRFKLFKNDDQECTALGSQSLDPGHQQEVTAAF